jgi:DNA-nicking Smr family endonuclease
VKRPIRPEEQKLWSMVAATVHRKPGRKAPPPEAAPPPPVVPKPAPPKAPSKPSRTPPPAPVWDGAPFTVGELAKAPLRPGSPSRGAERDIEPRRKHRIAKERDPIGARIDLHGLDQDRAQAALESFVLRAWDEGYRAVLVITGKGVRGGGVLRKRAPEWLASPALRGVVAGVSEAHPRHGGQGALYVALKLKPRG